MVRGFHPDFLQDCDREAARQSPRGELGRGEKQARLLTEFLWEAENATASQAVTRASPGELQYIFTLKTFLPSAMTSSKEKRESKEISILCYFPFLQTKHSWPEYLFCPALL